MTLLRPLTAADASAFQRLRLFALDESPSAFGSSAEDEASRSPADWVQWLIGSPERVFVGAWVGTELMGMVGVGREQGRKQRHIGFIRSLYVAPAARGQGIASRLTEAALTQLRSWPGVEQAQLAVTAGNAPAQALYRRWGFTEIGRLPQALCVDGFFFDEVLMWRSLRTGSGIGLSRQT